MNDNSIRLQLQHLGLSYRAKPALRDINWSWQQAEHWAVIGPNGSGKTTLAGVLCGDLTHFSGDFAQPKGFNNDRVAYVCFERGRRYFDRDQKLDCAEFSADAQDVGTRVLDFIPRDSTNSERWDAIVDLLEMRPILNSGIRFISTGEMRKTLLASAILTEPELLILDSPLDGLDAATQQRLALSLSSIINELPAVMVLCRDPIEIPEACNRVMVLNQGRVVAQGEKDAVLKSTIVQETLTPPSVTFQLPVAPHREMPPEQPLFELEDVSVSFGDRCIFKHVHWQFDQDSHCHIAGPNGCGKSTLLDLLTGDNHKAYGQKVTLFGRRRGTGESVWDIKSQFGRVDARMQFAVPVGNSVANVVESGHFDSIGLNDSCSDKQRRSAREWIKALGLDEQAELEFRTLSFGLQRLVLLARAMVKLPRILLLDEATSGLDRGHRELLLSAIDALASHGYCQILFVSHTAGERPGCINQVLEFSPGPDGSTVVVSSP